MLEEERIKSVYENRKNDKQLTGIYQGVYPNYVRVERENVYESIIRNHFPTIDTIKLLEVGAGNGSNLTFFNKLGIPYSNIFANELLNDRLTELKKSYPQVTIIPGSAIDINLNIKFDIVFQSTVFTSILDNNLRELLAKKMWNLLNDKGIILWYDFVFNNPKNKNVKKVSEQEIKMLFPLSKKIEFHKVTLAPPIGRRVGKFYHFCNRFKFLRTHVIAVIHN